MMKAAARNEKGEGVMILGFSHENIWRMVQGQPIRTSADFMGVKGEIFIFVARDEATMHEMMKTMIGPNTEVHIDPKLEKDI